MKENYIHKEVSDFLKTLPEDAFRWNSPQAGMPVFGVLREATEFVNNLPEDSLTFEPVGIQNTLAEDNLINEPKDSEGLLFDLYQYMYSKRHEDRMWSFEEVCILALENKLCFKQEFTDFEGAVAYLIDDLYDSGIIDYEDDPVFVDEEGAGNGSKFKFNTDNDSEALAMRHLAGLARLSGKVDEELLNDLDKAADRYQKRAWSPDELSS